MNRDDGPECRLTRADANRNVADRPCDRRDLAEWASHGGPLPARLAAHIRSCPACAERVRRINYALAGLTLLQTQPVPINTRARANARALRMLRRAARASAAAERLFRMKPNLSRWQRAQIHIGRVSLGAAAAVLMLLVRLGIFTGIEKSRIAGEQLVRTYEKHIDPDGEWFDHHNLA